MTNYKLQIINHWERFSAFSIQHSALSGFTLLEMIISIGIFSVLVVASIGITLGVSNAQLKASAVQAIQDNVRFGMELMSRELRTGKDYTILNPFCGDPGSEIKFNGTSGPRVYYLDRQRGVVFRSTQVINGSSDCYSPNSPFNKFTPLTADEIFVDSLIFRLQGAVSGPSDGQPMVTASMKLHSTDPKFGDQTSMILQTTVIQRLRDLQ